MTSLYNIRQPDPKPSQSSYNSHSVDANCFNLASRDQHTYDSNQHSLGFERASIDSTKTELSVNSRDVIIADQWCVLGRIGEGSFGEVFEVEDVDTLRHYAIKREPMKKRNPQMKHESIIYDELAGGTGIPQCHWYGHHEGFECIIIDLLGPNLNQLKEAVKPFPIEVVINFGTQIVTILEHIHNRGLVYRDVKPDNFLFSYKCDMTEIEILESTDDSNTTHRPSCEEVFRKWNEQNPKLYIVDFGLTSWWRDPQTNEPYPDTKKRVKNKTGTARYASLNVHRGKSHARRDDIESLGYLLLDLIFGTLPWTGIQARNSRAGWDRMKQIKEEIVLSDMCAGLPQGFLEYIEYSRRLRFSEEPDYNLLREYLEGCVNNGKYSTIVKSPFRDQRERKWTLDSERGPTATTHEDAPKSNAHRNNYKNRHYYEHQPQPGMSISPPHQRRASYNQSSSKYQHQQHQKDDTDVFAMDDLSNNLPSNLQKQNNSLEQPLTSNGSRARANSAGKNNNHANNKRTSGDFGCNSHKYHTASNENSSFQKLVIKNRRKLRPIGWNSHKHDEMPWEPQIDWEPPAAEKPDDTIAHASWGDDKLNGEWGNTKINSSWALEEEQGSWAASIKKPWE